MLLLKGKIIDWCKDASFPTISLALNFIFITIFLVIIGWIIYGIYKSESSFYLFEFRDPLIFDQVGKTLDLSLQSGIQKHAREHAISLLINTQDKTHFSESQPYEKQIENFKKSAGIHERFQILIGALVAFIAFQQWLTNEKGNKYKISDKVIECFELIEEANLAFIRTGSVDKRGYQKYMEALRIAKLYLSKSTIKKIENLFDIGMKNFLAKENIQSYEKLANSGEVTENQKKNYFNDQEILTETHKQVSDINLNLHKIFRKYLTM